MNFIFSCFNNYSLYFSYAYTRYLQNKGHNCTLIYRDERYTLPAGVYDVWNNVIYMADYSLPLPLPVRLLCKRAGNEFELKFYRYAVWYRQAIKDAIKADDDNVLMIPKDNNSMDATAIEVFRELTGRKGFIVIIEEGLAIYTHTHIANRLFYSQAALKIMRRLIGMSVHWKSRLPQGSHPLINAIICKHPERLDTIKRKGRLCIRQAASVFNKKDIEDFLENVCHYSIDQFDFLRKFTHLYLGQPLVYENIDTDEELDLIRMAARVLPEGCLLGIKMHPRDAKADRVKYAPLSDEFENVCIIPDPAAQLSVELLYIFMNNPVIITPFSSAYVNIREMNGNAPVILNYKLFCRPALDEMLIKSGIDTEGNNLACPQTPEEYIQALTSMHDNDTGNTDLPGGAMEDIDELLAHIAKLY